MSAASRQDAGGTPATTELYLHFPRNKSPDFAQYTSDGLYDTQSS
jgi:hypothetical protein